MNSGSLPSVERAFSSLKPTPAPRIWNELKARSTAVIALLLAGCGTAPSPVAVTAPDAEPAPAVVDEPPAAPPRVEWPDVPGDLFFPDPLAILADDTPLPGMTARTAAAANADPTPDTDMVAVETADADPAGDDPKAVDWAALIPPEDLNAEVAAVVERLEQRLGSVANYNAAYLELPTMIAELGALAAVAQRHPGSIEWKDRAGLVAEKAAAMNAEPLRRGAKSYKQASEPFAVLLAALRGGGSSPGGEPAEFADVSEFDSLMKRFGQGQEWLNVNASSEQLVAKDPAAVKREANVLAALSKVTAHESFGYGGFDPEFDRLSADMTAAATEMSATAGDNWTTFDLARSKLSASCSNCHGAYRN